MEAQWRKATPDNLILKAHQRRLNKLRCPQLEYLLESCMDYSQPDVAKLGQRSEVVRLKVLWVGVAMAFAGAGHHRRRLHHFDHDHHHHHHHHPQQPTAPPPPPTPTIIHLQAPQFSLRHARSGRRSGLGQLSRLFFAREKGGVYYMPESDLKRFLFDAKFPKGLVAEAMGFQGVLQGCLRIEGHRCWRGVVWHHLLPIN